MINTSICPVYRNEGVWCFNASSFREFLEQLQGLSRETAISYCRAVSYYLAWCKLRNFESTATYREYIQSLIEGAFSKSSINCLNTAIRRFNTWRNGKHFELEKGIKKEKRLVQIVPAEVIAKIEKAALSSKLDICEKHAIILLLYSGMRASEIVNNNFDERYYYTFHALKIRGKGDKERIVPLCGQLKKWIALLHSDDKLLGAVCHTKEYFEERARAAKWNSTTQVLREVLRKLCIDNNIDYYSPHAFRHTFATKLVSCGIPLIKVANVMGHSSIRVTQMYVHLQIDDLTYILNVEGEL